MRALVTEILAKLDTVTGVKFTRVWNDNTNLDENQKMYATDFPAILPEFLNPQEVKQLGDGVQLYDPLIVRLHILHWQIDDGAGNMEQNLDAFDFAQEVFSKMDGFEPDGCVSFVRVAEERDYTHKGLYHLMQDYKTNYIDSSRQRSTSGTTIAGDTIDPVLNITYDPKPYLKEK